MFLFILIGIIFIYNLVKQRERKDKIFYTFYLFVMSIVILPFFQFFDNIIVYSIYFLIYIFLLYSIYTDFEAFNRVWELFLKQKKIDQKNIQKIDYYLMSVLVTSYKELINIYKFKLYNIAEFMIDIILILIWILLCLVIYFIIK